MLVVSRRKGEAVLIRFGDKELRLEIGKLTASKVQINFEAPEEVRIIREELASCTTTKTMTN